MGSIPKIVSTPIKWVSKKLVHATLLRFPGGDPQSQVACVYCPELCRFSCPTAVVTGSDAVTPANKMGLIYKDAEWPGQVGGAGPVELWPLYDCTGCGRCTEYCVYEMPVAERLVAARVEHRWEKAVETLAALPESQDRWGDLAQELGDPAEATRRRERALAEVTGPVMVDEPKVVHALREAGVQAQWRVQEFLKADPKTAPGLAKFAGKRWLVHESVWASRRLGLHEDVRAFVRGLAAAGIEIVWSFHQGRDCIDCGGEGAYRRLFADQARAMAREIWERDSGRADGVFCFSDRCAEHLREALGVPVVSVGELASGQNNGPV